MKKNTVILITIMLGVILLAFVIGGLIIKFTPTDLNEAQQKDDYNNSVEDKNNQETIDKTYTFRAVFNYVFEGSPEKPNSAKQTLTLANLFNRKSANVYIKKITTYNALTDVDFEFSKSYATMGSFLDISNKDIVTRFQVNGTNSTNLGESLSTHLTYLVLPTSDGTARLKFVAPNNLGYVNFFNYVESMINRGTDDTEIFIDVSDFFSIFSEEKNTYVNAKIKFSFVVTEDYDVKEYPNSYGKYYY